MNYIRKATRSCDHYLLRDRSIRIVLIRRREKKTASCVSFSYRTLNESGLDVFLVNYIHSGLASIWEECGDYDVWWDVSSTGDRSMSIKITADEEGLIDQSERGTRMIYC